MGTLSSLIRILRSPRAALLYLEALAELTVAWARWKFLPFRRSIESSTIPLGGRTGALAHSPQDISKALLSLSKRMPFRAVCFQRGLAGQRMLRRRGYDAILHYGVVNLPHELNAHVWVTVNGEIVIGAEGMLGHAEVARFPAS